MKEGNQIKVTWINDGMLLCEGIVENIEFENDTFSKFTYLTNGGRSSMLVDRRFHNVEVIK
jgi:hypothetical protein